MTDTRHDLNRPAADKPKVIILCSASALPIAGAIQTNLDRTAAVKIWSQSVFGPDKTNIESILGEIRQQDFAIVLATADDTLQRKGRGKKLNVPTANVTFELGASMGILSRERTYVVYNRDSLPTLPSDLDGVVCLDFSPAGHGDDFLPATGAACYRIVALIKQYGKRA